MSAVLYRKYRPQNFAQMIGQNHIKITLQHELEKDEIAHAYLFCGPRGLGKTTSARLLAKALNCENRQAGESEPCNQCRSCNDIMAGHAVDVIEIDAASNTGVDNVRDNIIENSRFNPVNSKYKIFIIDEVHMLSISAFNALLKILEEPPTHVIFVLCTTEIHKLPVTIISRCQRFDFKRVSSSELLKRLELIVGGENKKIEAEVLKRIVSASDGCVRDAESLLTKIFSLGDEITLSQAEIILPRTDYQLVLNFVEHLLAGNSTASLGFLNRLIEEGFDLYVFVENLLEFLRKLLLLKSSSSLDVYAFEANNETQQQMLELASKIEWSQLLELLDLFLSKIKEMKTAPIIQLPLEMAVISFIYRYKNPDLEKKIFINPASTASKTVNQVTKNNPVHNISKIEVDSLNPSINSGIEKNYQESDIVIASDNLKQEDENATKSDGNQINDNSDVDLIVANWSLIVEKMIRSNFSIASTLRISQPLKFEKNCVEIAVSNSFYKACLEANNSRLAIEKVISEVLGFSASVKIVVSNNILPPAINIDFEKFEQESNISEQLGAECSTNDDSSITKAVNLVSQKLSPVEEVMNLF